MGIFSRFADIINSNLNALLDKAEDPEKMIKLIIQEMEDTLVEVRTNSARTIADKKELERKLDSMKREMYDWEQKAELALAKERDDLAKAALVEKSKINIQVEDLQNHLNAVSQSLDVLATEIEQLEDKLSDARGRQQALILKAKTSQSRLRVKEKLYDSRGADAMSKFEQYHQMLDRVEAKTEAIDLGRKKSLSEEIDELANQEKIDEELQALKARVGKQNKPSE